MGRRILAICDVEEAYAQRMMEYMNQRRTLPFEIQAFTSVDRLLFFAESHAIEILLISENAYTEQVENFRIGQIIVLRENQPLPTEGMWPSVYKYQPTSNIVREVMNCYDAERMLQEKTFASSNCRLYGIWSPQGESKSALFALIMGQLIAERKKVLYVNLHSYSVLPALLQLQSRQTVSDLIYYKRQSEGNISCRLNSMIQSLRKLDIVPPVLMAEDLTEVQEDEWRMLLADLQENAGYDAVLLDLGESMPQWMDLFLSCAKLFIVEEESRFSGLKAQAVLTELRERSGGNHGNGEDLIEVVIPERQEREGSEQTPEETLWGSLGEFVRKILKKEAML